MNDLDRIAINDMRHELCDVSPCAECADFKYQVLNNLTVLGTYYVRERALEFAKGLSEILKDAKGSDVTVQVYDLNDDSTEASCYYQFQNGRYVKVG